MRLRLWVSARAWPWRMQPWPWGQRVSARRAWVVSPLRPRLPSPDMPTRPLLDFGAGYVQRALAHLPRQGTSGPWVMAMDPNHDAQVLRHGPIEDPCLVFDKAVRPAHAANVHAAVAVNA